MKYLYSLPTAEEAPMLGLSSQNSSHQLAPRRGLLIPANGVWGGLTLAAAGFAAIFYTWGKVAGLVNVAQQMPYLISGGLAGLALIIVGVVVVDVSVRREDSHERRLQFAQVIQTLGYVGALLESEKDAQRPEEAEA